MKNTTTFFIWSFIALLVAGCDGRFTPRKYHQIEGVWKPVSITVLVRQNFSGTLPDTTLLNPGGEIVFSYCSEKEFGKNSGCPMQETMGHDGTAYYYYFFDQDGAGAERMVISQPIPQDTNVPVDYHLQQVGINGTYDYEFTSDRSLTLRAVPGGMGGWAHFASRYAGQQLEIVLERE